VVVRFCSESDRVTDTIKGAAAAQDQNEFMIEDNPLRDTERASPAVTHRDETGRIRPLLMVLLGSRFDSDRRPMALSTVSASL